MSLPSFLKLSRRTLPYPRLHAHRYLASGIQLELKRYEDFIRRYAYCDMYNILDACISHLKMHGYIVIEVTIVFKWLMFQIEAKLIVETDFTKPHRSRKRKEPGNDENQVPHRMKNPTDFICQVRSVYPRASTVSVE